VINASPIISICKIGRAGLLCELCDDIVIPSGVADEINQGPVNDPARRWLNQQGRNYVKDVGGKRSFVKLPKLSKKRIKIFK